MKKRNSRYSICDFFQKLFMCSRPVEVFSNNFFNLLTVFFSPFSVKKGVEPSVTRVDQKFFFFGKIY